MAVYNMSFLDNSTNIIDIAAGLGTATGQDFLLGYLILFSQFLIFLILAYRLDFKEVLIIDSFLCTISAIMLYIAGMLPAPIIAAPAVLMFVVIIWLYTSET